ncbi:MAG: tryptophan synthase subunit alpha [Candidatus Eremiobacteraeota bacterium]|nr:tryptophan synthase subunit alpha [Candidatus Eremiobacteraeota bacterium]MBV8355029.1 tryptophan synthase subunit alpha [Candidatus Eremiobacteraeota bacterium]
MTTLGRLEAVFARAREQRRPALIAYVVAGDPDAATTAAVLEALVQAGVDVVELGIPYGDPLADGPIIAAAAQRALAGGMGMERALALVPKVNAPVILFTYLNPVVQYGVARFAQNAAGAGAAGAIVPDAPLEESSGLRDALRGRGMAMPLLVAPTTPPERARTIAAASEGFVYLVSRLGVTGTDKRLDLAAVRAQVVRLRALTDRPIAVGFGINQAAQIEAIRDVTDGIIIGSALVDAFAGSRGAAAARAAAAFITPLRAAAVS